MHLLSRLLEKKCTSAEKNIKICSLHMQYPHAIYHASSVGITTKLRVGRSGDRIPVGGKILRTRPDRPWGPPSPLYNGYRVFTGGKERPGRDADPSPPSSAEVLEE
jgi:hypothetical protein